MVINVLVVDDSSVMRAMILKTMRMSGLPLGTIHQAGNGKEGLDILQQNWIDLVVVDINMPVMNGEEMIDYMRGNPETRDISVIVISTEGSNTRIERLLNKGAAFIHKPFTPENIRDTVRELMGLGANDEAGD
ncbi:Chemotaxis protein [Desulfonema limicola]|uniref:Chemotaxis protein n=1 Tax=Desulfonema limicola TaxID=45656 RepID=A0A975BAC7_9BACT|nr:response regulator [Desulfonema limicola]QTA81681.1 Chemotaxis protein [Desulfonema limicola]